MATLEQNFNVLVRNQRVYVVAALVYLIGAVVSAVLGHWHLTFFLLIMWLGVIIKNSITTLTLAVIASATRK